MIVAIESREIKNFATCIELTNNRNLEISSIYIPHDEPSLEFNNYLKTCLSNKRKQKKHVIVDDNNIQIYKENTVVQNFLKHLN